MPYKDPDIKKAKQKEYAKKHYLANTDEVKRKAVLSTRRARVRNRDYVINIKETTPCADCHQQFPHYAMHFDHIFEKNSAISDLVRAGGSIKALQREIDNCEVVCAICHATRTYDRLQEDIF